MGNKELRPTPETDKIFEENGLIPELPYSARISLRNIERQRDEAREREANWIMLCQNLVKVKGRHNSQIAYDRIVQALAEAGKEGA